MLRKMLVLAVASVMLCGAVAQAGPVKVFKLDAGHYLIQGTDIVPVQIVGPVDPPVVPPVVPPVDDLTKVVVAAVNKIPVSDARHAAALKLSAVCQVLGEQVTAGKIHPTDGAQALQLIGKAALAKDAKDWAGVLTVIETALTKATTAEASAGVLTVAGAAVLSTVPASDGASAKMKAGGPLSENEEFKGLAEKYGFDWTAFLEFVMQLLTLLLPLIT